MSTLESNKNMAGIGAILIMLAFIPTAGIILGLIGVILLFMGVKGLSEYYQDTEIYRETLSGIILYVIAIIAIGVAFVGLTFGSIFGTSIAGLIGFGIGLLIFIGGLIVGFIFYVLAALRFRRAFNTLAQKSGEHLFTTAGTLLYIGAILTIIVVGLALIFIAWLILAIAFFSIRLPSQSAVYAPPPSTAQATRYCPNCGQPVEPNATYCPHCGKPLTPS